MIFFFNLLTYTVRSMVLINRTFSKLNQTVTYDNFNYNILKECFKQVFYSNINFAL